MRNALEKFMGCRSALRLSMFFSYLFEPGVQLSNLIRVKCVQQTTRKQGRGKVIALHHHSYNAPAVRVQLPS
jgi:hypothetical protein